MVTTEKLNSFLPDLIVDHEEPIDLKHLAMLTMNDKCLEKEVLDLFVAQIPVYLTQVTNCSNSEDTVRLAHTIKGAARSIGAFTLAELARQFENSGAIDLARLEKEFKRIQEFIFATSGK